MHFYQKSMQTLRGLLIMDGIWYTSCSRRFHFWKGKKHIHICALVQNVAGYFL